MAAGTGKSKALSKFRKASLQMGAGAKKKPNLLAAAMKSAAAPAQDSVAPGSLQKKMGDVHGVNGLNAALWGLGVFKHEPPKFKYFDPELSSHLEVLFKEVRVPRADQTHEILFEPATRCVFVSQLTNSVLVRIPVAEGGLLLDDQDAWRVGPVGADGETGLGGLHNLSLSTHHPGCIWVSLQLCNEVFLIEAATMKIRFMLKVPTMLVRPDKTAVRIGGPHCVRECGQTGKIWVALKGSVGCHPAETPDRAKATTNPDAPTLKKATERVCCSAKALKKRMQQLEELGYNTPPPEGFAIWHVDPREYDPDASDGACGGVLFESLPSPPMITIDKHCNAWVAQDQSESILFINGETKETKLYSVGHPEHDEFAGLKDMTGPAIATAPDGAIWCSLLASPGSLVRICPVSHERTVFEIKPLIWMKCVRIIHIAFHTHYGTWSIFRNKKMTVDRYNLMFVISSDLVDKASQNVLIIYVFRGDCWDNLFAVRAVPIPTQESCCHRVEVIAEGLKSEEQSVVVTQLNRSKIFQMKIHNAITGSSLEMLSEVISDEKEAHDKGPGLQGTMHAPWNEDGWKNSITWTEDGSTMRLRKFEDTGGFTTGMGSRGQETEASKLFKRKVYRACEMAIERPDGMLFFSDIANEEDPEDKGQTL